MFFRFLPITIVYAIYREDIVLSFFIADQAKISEYSEITSSVGVRGARSQRTTFLNTLQNHLPSKKATFADEAREIARDRKIILKQLLEKLRAESDSKRQELLSILIQDDDDDKPYDIYSKCLEIARRIMRGEKVTAEEMRLLSRYFPELLFQALLLKQEDVELDGNDDLQNDGGFSWDNSGNSDGAEMQLLGEAG